jgi:hypothetical protein
MHMSNRRTDLVGRRTSNYLWPIPNLSRSIIKKQGILNSEQTLRKYLFHEQ